MDYVVIVPAKDEEAHIAVTIESVITQTVKPKLCLVVDDGSRDRTPDIVRKYERTSEQVRLLQLEDKGSYSLGAQVVALIPANRARAADHVRRSAKLLLHGDGIGAPWRGHVLIPVLDHRHIVE